jgi:hypothetical protein
MKEQSTSSTWSCLRQFLGRLNAERKAATDQPRRQAICEANTSLSHHREAVLFDLGDAILDALEGASVEQIRRVNDVARRA